jgi:AraC family transcriptional regulator
MFTRNFGISRHHYVNRIRLEKAMAEIAACSLPLAQMAFNARFSSQASFTRAFHRATGMTPAEYRRCRRLLIVLDHFAHRVSVRMRSPMKK